MDVQGIDAGAAQQRVQEAAAVMVESRAIDSMKEQGEAVSRLIESAPPQPISDPSLGNRVDILA